MKISNIDELQKLMENYFKEGCLKIDKSEENIMKEQIKESIKKIEGSTSRIKYLALHELKRWYRTKFEGEIQLVKFVCECLCIEDKIQLIKGYLQSQKTSEYSNELIINRDHLLMLLDYLPDEFKIEALTNARPVDLIRIMGEINAISKDWRNTKKVRKYYKNYYEIFKKVLVEYK